MRIVETLTGNPCRCMCQSTIRSVVGLKPGQYDLSLTLIETGRTREILRQDIEIKRLRP